MTSRESSYSAERTLRRGIKLLKSYVEELYKYNHQRQNIMYMQGPLRLNDCESFRTFRKSMKLVTF